MILIGLVGGLITGISPCVLPVLPVVFVSGGAQPGVGAGGARWRPYLVVAGLATSFSAFTLLGTLILSALPLPKDIIRWTGLAVLVLVGVAMMFPTVQELLERPFARLGRRRIGGEHGGFILGLALGAVYVPCAGPVLAAITVAGATGHIGLRTVALTVAFAVGTAIPLLFFALAGRHVVERVRAFRERQRGYRVVAGVLIIGLAVALTFNVTDALQRTVPDYTASLNKALDGPAVSTQLGRGGSLQQCAAEPATVLQSCGKAGDITGIDKWLNTANGSAAQLAGSVTLVDFWAYSCINCQRAIPHIEAWYSAYRADGLQVIGVHTPEYAFEHVPGNVAAGAKRLGITYPVALDNEYKTWDAFDNDSWPAEYLVDATGQVRHVAIGEGDYATSEALIRQLLTAAKPTLVLPKGTDVPDTTPTNPDQTPESYLGSERANNAANSARGTLDDGAATFTVPTDQPKDSFALEGAWTVAAESVTSGRDASITLDFDASDVYLDVGGTGTLTATVNGASTTLAVSGAPDIYPVVHRGSPVRATVTITFSPGLSAYSFTFG